MSEPRYISPMLDGFSLGQAISDHHGVVCYPAMRDDSEKRYIVKKISLPASQVQVEALLLTGVYKDADAVCAYYEELAQGIAREVQTLDTLAGQRGFVPYKDHQIVPMEQGVGYEVHLISRYRMTLERYLRRNRMTHLSAVNLGIDMCAALAVCREAGWLYVDLKPENIYLFNDQEYRIGDLGFQAMDMLAYSSLPERCRSIYTAPEVPDAYSSLNATMDTYALGLILYQVYNDGALPYTNAEEQADWLEKLRSGESMPAPVCADADMTAIITKAIAADPADRWQTPAEMGHALISYMQRNGADDIPLVPPAPEPEIEEAPAEEAPVMEIPAEEPAVAENPADEIAAEVIPVEEPVVEETTDVESAIVETPDEETVIEEAPDEEPVVEEASAEESVIEEAPAEEPVTEEAPAEESVTEEIPAEEPVIEEAPAEEPAADESDVIAADWIDLMDAFLAEEEDGTEPEADADEPTLRQLLGDEEEYRSNAEEVTEEDVSNEAADILSFANALIEHEAPAPVVVPEPIDVPIPEPIPVELPEEEAPQEEPVELPVEEEAAEEAAEASEPETPAPAVPVEEKPKSGFWKKLLGAVAALAVTAGLAFGGWYYYQNYYLQNIDDIDYQGSAREIVVSVYTKMDHSKLAVICKDTYGNAVTGSLENGSVTFSDLVPGSQYIIALEPTGFNKLTGSTSITYSTPAETQIINLTAVTGQEAGTAIVSFGVEGSDCEEWTLRYATEGMATQSIPFTGHTVTIPELTVGSEYTFILTAPEDVILVGETTIQHTASELVQASNLTLSDYQDGVLTVSWNAPEGVDRWIVRCFDGAGYDQLQEVTGTTASFEGVTEGTKYTVEVTAATQTLGIRSEITADSSNISGFTATLNGSTIALSWNYGGEIPEGGWKIAWSADGGQEQLLTAEENKATLSPAAPGAVYSFTIQSPEGSSIAPVTTTLETPAAGTFSANKLDAESIIVEMFDVPSKDNWGYSTLQRSREEDTFKAGSSLALLYTVTKPYTFDDTAFETIFVIRDSEGKLVGTSSRSRSWDDMWDNGYCTEQVNNLPAAAGSYKLSIYLGNGLLAELPFTVE